MAGKQTGVASQAAALPEVGRSRGDDALRGDFFWPRPCRDATSVPFPRAWRGALVRLQAPAVLPLRIIRW